MKWLKKIGYYIALPFVVIIGILMLYAKKVKIAPIDKEAIAEEKKNKEKETDEKISNMSATDVATEYLSNDSRNDIQKIVDVGTKRILDAIRRNSIGTGNTKDNSGNGG